MILSEATIVSDAPRRMQGAEESEAISARPSGAIVPPPSEPTAPLMRTIPSGIRSNSRVPSGDRNVVRPWVKLYFRSQERPP